MESCGSTAVFLGILFLLCGAAVIGGLLNDNDYLKVPWRVWDPSEHAWAFGGGSSTLAGILLLILVGCGGSLPEPTDPVTVEVVACEPTLGGTHGQYLSLETQRMEVGICEAAMAEESARQAIRNFAERDVDRLGQEFDVYRARGRTDCYCGPVCQEMTKFLLEARANGLFCGP
ncbi:MAG: hypothetical protein WC348_02985 [Patescibacteria group bacterium]|jgi:hypothetical protein